MKHLSIGKLLLFALFTGLWFGLGAREMVYYVDMSTFYGQDDAPYVEYYLDVDAGTILFKQGESGSFSGTIDVHLKIENQVTGEAVYDRQFQLLSPSIADTSGGNTQFGIMDVRRISLDPGRYVFTGVLKDGNDKEGQKHKFVRDLEIEEASVGFSYLSSIEYIQTFRPTAVAQGFSKHGYDIVPLVTNGNYFDQDSIKYYMEIYHSERQTEKALFVNAYVTLANSTEKIPGCQKFMRMEPKSMNLVTGGFDIASLPSQTYYLNVDVYSQKNELMANTSRKFFVVNSRVEAPQMEVQLAYDEHFSLDEKELDKYIHTLYYISTPTERDFASAVKTLDEKQKYFLNFWYKRKGNANDSPAKPWRAYKSRVDHANKNFKAAHLAGWRTDRGRMMLTYGPPNDIERFPSSNTNHPYQIWRYNKVKTQANLICVFYTPNTATDESVLLHSNILGEQNNPRWEFEVIRTVQDGNLDVNSIHNDYGN